MPAYGGLPSDTIVNTNEITVELLKVAEWGGMFVEGSSAVDINRNKIVDRVLKTDADFIWWIDSDNLPPVDALGRLLGVRKPLVSGLYYGGAINTQVIPVAYLRRPDGAYHALNSIYQWERGEIVPVDGVGMGCFLTATDVFRHIEKEFVDIQTQQGWRTTVHKDDIKDAELRDAPNPNHPYGNKIKNGMLYVPVFKPTAANIFPHFQSQFTRTEDFVFCENARRLGYEIMLDTSVEVGHLKQQNVDGKTFRKHWGKSPSDKVQEVVHV